MVTHDADALLRASGLDPEAGRDALLHALCLREQDGRGILADAARMATDQHPALDAIAAAIDTRCEGLGAEARPAARAAHLRLHALAHAVGEWKAARIELDRDRESLRFVTRRELLAERARLSSTPTSDGADAPLRAAAGLLRRALIDEALAA